MPLFDTPTWLKYLKEWESNAVTAGAEPEDLLEIYHIRLTVLLRRLKASKISQTFFQESP